MQRHGRVMLAILNESPPTDEEWERWIELGRPRLGADVRCICELYDSAGPNARQRRLLTPWIGKVDMRTAVLSDSMLVRGVVTAVSWLGVANSAFAAGDLDGAARYLELTPDEARLAAAQLATLRETAGVRRRPRPSASRFRSL